MKSLVFIFIAVASFSVALGQGDDNVEPGDIIPRPTHSILAHDVPVEDLTAAAPRCFQVRFFLLRREIDLIDMSENRHGYPMNCRILLRYAVEKADELFQTQEACEFIDLFGEDAIKLYRLALWLQIFNKNTEIEARIGEISKAVVTSYVASNTEKIEARLKEVMELFDDETLIGMIYVVTGSKSAAKDNVHALDSLRGNDNLGELHLREEHMLNSYTNLRLNLEHFVAKDETALERAKYILDSWQRFPKLKAEGKSETIALLFHEDLIFRLNHIIFPLLSEEHRRLYPKEITTNKIDNERMNTPARKFARELRELTRNYVRAQYSSRRAIESRLVPLLWLYAPDYRYVELGYFIPHMLNE